MPPISMHSPIQHQSSHASASCLCHGMKPVSLAPAHRESRVGKTWSLRIRQRPALALGNLAAPSRRRKPSEPRRGLLPLGRRGTSLYQPRDDGKSQPVSSLLSPLTGRSGAGASQRPAYFEPLPRPPAKPTPQRRCHRRQRNALPPLPRLRRHGLIVREPFPRLEPSIPTNPVPMASTMPGLAPK
jgi:hypothetical protein